MIINGNLDLRNSNIRSLGEITEVKGLLDLQDCFKLKNLGKLRKVGSIYLMGTKIEEFPKNLQINKIYSINNLMLYNYENILLQNNFLRPKIIECIAEYFEELLENNNSNINSWRLYDIIKNSFTIQLETQWSIPEYNEENEVIYKFKVDLKNKEFSYEIIVDALSADGEEDLSHNYFFEFYFNLLTEIPILNSFEKIISYGEKSGFRYNF